MKLQATLACFIFLTAAWNLALAAKEEDKAAEKELVTKYSVKIKSSKDSTDQDALFFYPPNAAPKTQGEPAPLLVTLHTWSSTFTLCTKYIAPAQARGWVMVAPNFRGPNSKPEACASELAIQDILDAVEYAKQHARVDVNRIYLLGGSGGGHMSLMMAGKAPELWAAVSSWVPISDVKAWHAESLERKNNYAKMLESACGGPPNATTNAQYEARSPLTFIAQAKDLPLDINTGIHDGHTGSVPVSHSLRAFNTLAVAKNLKDKIISDEDIASMVKNEKIPDTLAAQTEKDPERDRLVLFRRVAGSTRISVFEGGHAEDMYAGLAWLARQKKGQPADFTLAKDGSARKGTGATQEVAK